MMYLTPHFELEVTAQLQAHGQVKGVPLWFRQNTLYITSVAFSCVYRSYEQNLQNFIRVMSIKLKERQMSRTKADLGSLASDTVSIHYQ